MYPRIHSKGAVVAIAIGVLLCGLSGAAFGHGKGALLDSGSRGGYAWTVEASGGRSSASCLEVAIAHRHGRFSFDRSRFRRCAPRLQPSDPALVVGGRELGRGADGMTVVALAFAPGVQRAQVAFAGGRVESLLPRPLPGAPAGPGYAIVAGRANFCLTGITSVGAGGASLWRIAGEPCLPRLDTGP